MPQAFHSDREFMEMWGQFLLATSTDGPSSVMLDASLIQMLVVV